MNSPAQVNMQLDDASFRAISDLAYRESGLTLVAEKATMIQSRLRHRLRALGIDSFPDYCTLIGSDDGVQERRHLISALTTNVSHFFREKHHFETLKKMLDTRLPHLRAGGQMRIWSAGCSNGQEAVSAVMTLLEHAPEVADLDLRILATDIDPEVVSFARAGTYAERLMGGVPDPLRARYFEAGAGAEGEQEYTTKDLVRRMIRFNELNLLKPWPMTRPFDLIMCRNVVIYFDAQTQTALWPRFHKTLKPDGMLFLGHSERISDPSTYKFDCVGPTTYAPTPP
ncbi:protein-glutamate O-methyltransferase CheR [uncultured Sulfitobacter sp.]|uniref:CheR family methyltransferase n=1 Tax=uncultured Sulfitobacter sp. TaxID=191468 RepID=UPI002608FDC5|nr:protein-glutamate O-methyltransferase [uncultured Sulfitobacter sp.]